MVSCSFTCPTVPLRSSNSLLSSCLNALATTRECQNTNLSSCSTTLIRVLVTRLVASLALSSPTDQTSTVDASLPFTTNATLSSSANIATFSNPSLKRVSKKWALNSPSNSAHSNTAPLTPSLVNTNSSTNLKTVLTLVASSFSKSWMVLEFGLERERKNRNEQALPQKSKRTSASSETETNKRFLRNRFLFLFFTPPLHTHVYIKKPHPIEAKTKISHSLRVFKRATAASRRSPSPISKDDV